MANTRFLPILKFLSEYQAFSRTRVYELLKQKKIKARKLGGQTLIDCDSADALLNGLPEYKAQSSGERK